MNIRALAEAIADDLFVNGFGERAERLVLTFDRQDLGGLCRAAVIERVEERIRRAMDADDCGRGPSVPIPVRSNLDPSDQMAPGAEKSFPWRFRR